MSCFAAQKESHDMYLKSPLAEINNVTHIFKCDSGSWQVSNHFLKYKVCTEPKVC